MKCRIKSQTDFGRRLVNRAFGAASAGERPAAAGGSRPIRQNQTTRPRGRREETDETQHKKPKGGPPHEHRLCQPHLAGGPHCPVTVTTGAGAVVTAALGSLTPDRHRRCQRPFAMKLPPSAGALPLYWGQRGFGTLAVPGREVFPAAVFHHPGGKFLGRDRRGGGGPG